MTFDYQVDNSNDGARLVEAEAAVPSVAVVASDHGGGGVVSHNLGGADLSVVPHDGGAVRHLGAGLGALGGDGLLAVLDGRDVHHGLAHGPGHLAGRGHRHLVAGLDGDGLADGGGGGHEGRGGVSVVAGISLGLGLPLTVAGVVRHGHGGGV